MSISTLIFIAVIVWMVWMHAGGHGGCGGHGSQKHSGGGADGR